MRPPVPQNAPHIQQIRNFEFVTVHKKINLFIFNTVRAVLSQFLIYRLRRMAFAPTLALPKSHHAL
jgi:hypothetical protein